MSMRIDDRDGQRSKASHGVANLSHAQSSVEQERTFFSQDQIGDDFPKLFRFVDREHPGTDTINFKPGLVA